MDSRIKHGTAKNRKWMGIWERNLNTISTELDNN